MDKGLLQYPSIESFAMRNSDNTESPIQKRKEKKRKEMK
jgi:hypothetical protein